MKITYNELTKSDTATLHNINNTPTPEHKDNLLQLLSIINIIGDDFPDPVIITSGYRSKELNTKVGGVATSHHLEGYAADLTTKELKRFLQLIKDKYMQYIDQLIYYPKRNFIHVSVHPNNRQMYFEL